MKGIKKLKTNPNANTDYGRQTVTDSIQANGWGDALVAAADGTLLSGNLRGELAEDIFKVEPVIVRTDGTRPVVHIRTDIPGEADPKAQRLILASNRTGQLDFNPDSVILVEMLDKLKADGGLAGTGYSDHDLTQLLEAAEAAGATVDLGAAPAAAPEKPLVHCPKCGFGFAK